MSFPDLPQKKKCLFVETSRRPQRGTAARVRAATDLETRARVRSTHCFDRTRSLIACARFHACRPDVVCCAWCCAAGCLQATKAPGAVDAAAQQPSCTAGTSSGARAKKRAKKAPKTGLIQARADGDARGRAERELLEFREFAGNQMETGELTDDATTNPLQWWKKWGSKFPNLAQLARRYLAMPATSAPVERLFSVAGLVATAKRNRLAPSTVSLLVFLHEALPISRGLEVDSMLKSLDHDSDDSDEVMMMDES